MKMKLGLALVGVFVLLALVTQRAISSDQTHLFVFSALSSPPETKLAARSRILGNRITSVSFSGTSNSQLPLNWEAYQSSVLQSSVQTQHTILGLKSQLGHLIFKYSSILSHPKSSYAVNVS
ncbi:hypothetical protein COCMIDRAFT_28802 [Bipolaris oryzae ATCC 44560]|uniref:Uncharacterized protein n=1 Tax=Bipolaris oryzae ATCC 44560 TaxID=930090 RepID=W6ZGK0_COCMI|nr:uncharacterized protein COCMIDRAFT_28802 [Bipolaris oryzae ATCC 44560]EUC42621.1 hypothetical protein COCMIDRAFT_28802 [Bipolaris oryzae ATCC 44560]